MPRYRLTVAYDGTRYHGWQRQTTGISIQEVMEKAGIALTAPQPCHMYASGRTDAGVHARGQVVYFDMERALTPLRVRRALNSTLPSDIQVLDARETTPTFNAMIDAKGKEYRYYVWNHEVIPPDKRLYMAHVRMPLDIGAMRQAAQLFVGKHDYTAFSAVSRRELKTMVREVYACEVVQDGPVIEFHVSGRGFLYKMVRSISGFLIAVGSGREKPEAVTEVFETKARTARVESAPARGLFLWRVWYE